MPEHSLPEPDLRLFDGYKHTSPELRGAARRLQTVLRQRGYSVAVDGYFGHATARAVLHFQNEHALDPDGIAGPLTWAALRGETAPEFRGTLTTAYPTDSPALLQELPLVDRYRAFIDDGAALAGVAPAIIFGIGSRESRWGLALDPPGPAGTGDTIRRASRKPWRAGDLPDDGGFGRGLMQIDFDAHEFARTGDWHDPGANIAYGCGVLRQNVILLRRRTGLEGDALLRAAVAAYNCGAGNVLRAIARHRDADYYTHGRDYARDVLGRAEWFGRRGTAPPP